MIEREKFEDILEKLAHELPEAFYSDLNGGIRVSDEAKLHTKSMGDDLYILGEYCVDSVLGRSIVIYYGSFGKIYGYMNEESITKELRRVLRHEFRHHLESLGGERGLELIDKERIDNYLKKYSE